jgi:hypothetical protein
VVWGHEHECIGPPVEESLAGTYRILQPGSTVATSLVPGEAKRKHAVLLTVRGENFKVVHLPLTQVTAGTGCNYNCKCNCHCVTDGKMPVTESCCT